MCTLRNIFRLLFFSLFCFCCTVTSSQELWTDFRINLHLTNSIQIQPDYQVRLRHNPSLQSYAYLYKLGIKYSLNDKWRLGSSFRVTESQEKYEILTAEIPDRKRYTFDVYYKIPVGNGNVKL